MENKQRDISLKNIYESVLTANLLLKCLLLHKVLKFLFRNYPGDFSVAELAERIQESNRFIKKEVDVHIFEILRGLHLIRMNHLEKHPMVMSRHPASQFV